jgi:hypothetical protein
LYPYNELLVNLSSLALKRMLSNNREKKNES